MNEKLHVSDNSDNDEIQSSFHDDDNDVANELFAERKILRIGRLLEKTVMDKIQKRRLQNRKSAIKCRMRKSHLITTLLKEVSRLKALNLEII